MNQSDENAGSGLEKLQDRVKSRRGMTAFCAVLSLFQACYFDRHNPDERTFQVKVEADEDLCEGVIAVPLSTDAARCR